MSSKRYTEEFKVAAVKQVIDRGHPTAEVNGRPQKDATLPNIGSTI